MKFIFNREQFTHTDRFIFTFGYIFFSFSLKWDWLGVLLYFFFGFMWMIYADILYFGERITWSIIFIFRYIYFVYILRSIHFSNFGVNFSEIGIIFGTKKFFQKNMKRK